MGIALLASLVFVSVPVVAGIVLIVFGCRMRRRTHAACGKCGYNVAASIESSSRCPECGGAFGDVGILAPQTNNRNRAVLISLGVALVLLPPGVIGLSIMLSAANRPPPPRSANITIGLPAPPAYDTFEWHTQEQINTFDRPAAMKAIQAIAHARRAAVRDDGGWTVDDNAQLDEQFRMLMQRLREIE